jgi:hypothetical protein
MKWWRRRKREDDLNRELLSDLELEADEQEERGLSPKEAQPGRHCVSALFFYSARLVSFCSFAA